MTIISLTKKQENIYARIKNFIEKNGYSPSVREIGQASNLRSPSTVYGYLKILKEKGYITYEERKPRTIRILKWKYMDL